MSMLPPMILELRAKTGEFTAALAAAKGEIRALGDSSTSGMAKVATAGKIGKAAFLGVGAAAAIVGYEAVKQATSFQQSTLLLQTAGGETAKNLGMVRDGILKVAQDTGISTQNISDGMYIVEKSGNRGAAGLQVLRAAAEGATAEGVDMATMTSTLTSVMASFNIPASGATKAMSAIDRAAGLSKTTMAEFAGSLSNVLPVANGAHMALDPLLGNIAAMTQHGMSAQQATQDLAHAIGAMQNPSLAAQKAMQQMGVNATTLQTALSHGGLIDAFQILETSITKHLGPAGTVVVTAFKQSQQAAANAQVELSKMPPTLQKLSKELLAGSIGAYAYHTQTKKLPLDQATMAAGFMKTAQASAGFNTMLTNGTPATRTAAQALRQMAGDSTTLHVAQMLSGSSMKTSIEDTKAIAAQSALAGVHIANFAETQSTLAVKLGKAKEAVQVLFIKIGTALLPVVGKVADVFAGWVNYLSSHTGVLKTVGIVIGSVLVLAFYAWAAAAAAAAAATIAATWPVLAIGAAIAALVVGIIYVWKHWSQIWGWIKDLAGKVWSWLSHAASDLWHGLVTAFTKVLDFFGQIGTWIWDKVSALTSAVTGYGVKILTWLWNGIKSVASSVWSWFAGIGTSIWGAISGLAGTIVGFGAKIFNWIWDGIKTVAHGVWKWFSLVGSQIWAVIGPLVGTITKFGVKILTWIWNGIKSIAGTVWSWFSGVAGWIWSKVSALAGRITSFGKSVLNWMWDGIKSIAGSVWGWFSGVAGWIWGKVSVLAGTITSYGGSILTWMWNGIKSIATSVWAWFTGIGTSIWNAISGLATTIGGYGQDIINWLADGIYTMWTSVGHWFAGLWNNITGWIGNIATDAYNWGASLVQSIINGIGSMTSQLATAVAGLVSQGAAALNPFSSSNQSKGINLMAPPVINGLAKPNALGGPVTPGWNTFGEQGVEMGYTDPSGRTTIFSNPSTPGGHKAPTSGGGNTQHITVQVATNASPARIASEIGWKLRQMA